MLVLYSLDCLQQAEFREVLTTISLNQMVSDTSSIRMDFFYNTLLGVILRLPLLARVLRLRVLKFILGQRFLQDHSDEHIKRQWSGCVERILRSVLHL